MDEALLAALTARFGRERFRTDAPPDPIVVFPAKHRDVGDLKVWAPKRRQSSAGDTFEVELGVGDIIRDAFKSYDTHLSVGEREARVTRDVLRFLDELFADRLLFWRSTDAAGRTGWRERGEAGHSEPLVLDDRTYAIYLWSRPLGIWRATSTVLARGRIRDEREYHILLTRLRDAGPGGYDAAERELVGPLVADYQREHGV
jgi:hypothetical protein